MLFWHTVSDIPSGSIYGIRILTFFLAYILTFSLTFYLASTDILSGIFSGVHSGILSGIYFDILSLHSFWQNFLASILTFFLAFYLTYSGGAPALPTEIWRSRLRSGTAHWALGLAVDAEAGKRRRWAGQLWQNLQTLTWQVGNQVRTYKQNSNV